MPDAENRLQICEKHFKKSYGENLDRVMTLKGNAANERALIMRMHLLQSILNFHKNQRNSAFELLSTAELEWQQLQVNEGLVDTLVEMGNSTYSNENAIIYHFQTLSNNCFCVNFRLHNNGSTHWPPSMYQ